MRIERKRERSRERRTKKKLTFLFFLSLNSRCPTSHTNRNENFIHEGEGSRGGDEGRVWEEIKGIEGGRRRKETEKKQQQYRRRRWGWRRR